MKGSKTVNILCSLLLGMIVATLVLLLLAQGERTDGQMPETRPKLVFTTDSAEKLYDAFPLTAPGWDVKGSLGEGHAPTVQVTGSRTDAGESANTATLQILDGAGNDVTSLYDIQYEFGSLRVQPRTLTVISSDATKIYDGEPLTAPGYVISGDCDGLVVGHKTTVGVTGYIVDVGATANTISSVLIFDTLENDVTSNYRLLLREGVLIIEDGTDHSGGEPGGVNMDGNSDLLPPSGQEEVVIYSVYGETDGYVYLKVRSFGKYNGTGWEEAPVYTALLDNTYSAAYLTSCALNEAGRRARILRIKSFCGDYGLPYYFTAGSGETQADDTFFSGNTDEIYEISYYEASKDLSSLYSPYLNYEKEYRAFVRENYLDIDRESLAYMNALIEREGFSADDPEIVSAVASYIQKAAVYTRNYPREMESARNVAIAFLEEYKQGVCRHYASAAVLLYRALGIPARYTVGALAQTKTGEWSDVRARSAHAWVEVYLDGVGWIQVEVTGSADGANTVTLKPAEAAFAYDGKDHTAPHVLVGFEQYERRGYTYETQVSGVRTEVGVSETVITDLKIFNSLGKDVTFKFNIELQKGVLRIYTDTIVLESADEVLTYGDVSSVPAVTYDLSGLSEPLTVIVTRKTDMHVGQRLNLFDVKLLNAVGEDVTERYHLIRRYGKLTVTPLPITFKAGDASKVYDGEALRCEELSLVSGALLEGHSVGHFEISGSQKSVGRSENVITHLTVHDEKGRNVTANYAVSLLPGKLTVTMQDQKQ